MSRQVKDEKLATRDRHPCWRRKALMEQRPTDEETYHIYESNPVPWWIAILWVAFFIFAVIYLFQNLLAG